MDERTIGIERKDGDIVGIAGFHEDDGCFDADGVKIIEEARGGVIGEGVILGKELFLWILGAAHEYKDMFHRDSYDRRMREYVARRLKNSAGWELAHFGAKIEAI